MGWARGVNADGREIGYGVEAVCDEPDCEAKIDRGLAYACGGTERVLGRSEVGCGGYFCTDHLGFARVDGKATQLCDRCYRDDEDSADD